MMRLYLDYIFCPNRLSSFFKICISTDVLLMLIKIALGQVAPYGLKLSLGCMVKAQNIYCSAQSVGTRMAPRYLNKWIKKGVYTRQSCMTVPENLQM